MGEESSISEIVDGIKNKLLLPILVLYRIIKVSLNVKCKSKVKEIKIIRKFEK